MTMRDRVRSAIDAFVYHQDVTETLDIVMVLLARAWDQGMAAEYYAVNPYREQHAEPAALSLLRDQLGGNPIE